MPQELWTGETLYHDHLRVFGCETYVHIPKYYVKLWILNVDNIFSLVMQTMDHFDIIYGILINVLYCSQKYQCIFYWQEDANTQ